MVRAIDKDCGSSDNLLPALLLAVKILYFNGLGHHMKSSSVSLLNEKKFRGIIKYMASFVLYCEITYFSFVSGPDMTPSLASHCWCPFYFTHLKNK